MLLLSSLNFLFDAGLGDSSRPHNSGIGKTDFPTGRLTSTAWEGWWHEDAA
jgi:hypothetical protein